MLHTGTAPMRSAEPLGVYIHIPFCKSKCPYCDFCSFPHPDEALMSAYVDRLAESLALWGEKCKHRGVDTVYFGGGTPTLLPQNSVSTLLSAVSHHFHLLPDAEITLECNPATINRTLLSLWHEGGVNRLSMGAQSAHAIELKGLGRLHTWDDVIRTVEISRAVGIDNINLDFMIGIPHQTPQSLIATLDAAISLAPDHLSAYCLMIEEGTPFAKRGVQALGIPDDDGMADLFELASSHIKSHGYEHYEISNYAHPGKRSRHNLHTWQGKEYIGIGVAAHGYVDSVRYGNSRDLKAFLAGEDIVESRRIITSQEAVEESVMLGLRLSDGIDLADIFRRMGKEISSQTNALLRRLSEQGLIRSNGTRISLTDQGFLLSNQIISLLLEALM
ncbi:MAG: radical SAM family heme chaperone HemW [Ruminococcaceae bacterium]|nr:radical SAM family heme chaperone HemW [Oscillospiraceae bacterium]